jgi:hypothetical protein
LVLEEAHGILNKHFVLQTDELDYFFGHPRPDDLQVDLAHIYLNGVFEREERRRIEMYFCVELRGKLDRFEELELLV